MTENELDRCECCRTWAEIVFDDKLDKWKVQCASLSCSNEVESSDKESAITAWNTRGGGE